MALEMLDEVADLDMLVVPVGGGGLIAGNAVAAKALRPGDRDHRRRERALSLDVECAHRRELAVGGATLAEGIAVKNVGKLTLPVVRDWSATIVLVDEALLERAVKLS